MFTPPSNNEIFVRVPVLNYNNLEWRDEWLTPCEIEEKDIMIGTGDEDMVEELLKLKHNGIWEVDRFYFHEAVQDNPKERPYYPYVILWADQDTGIILNNELVHPELGEDYFKPDARKC